MRFAYGIVVFLGLTLAACGPTPSWAGALADGDYAHDAGDVTRTAVAKASQPVPEPAQDAGAPEGGDVPEEAQAPPAAPAPVVPPPTLAEQFQAAGGQALCVAAVQALNDDWNLRQCTTAYAADDPRRASCERSRAPVDAFVRKICEANLEASAFFGLDPLLAVAVMERESSTGRLTFNPTTHTYAVQTDVCKLFLATERIVKREKTERDGIERITWTYSGDHRNTQRVIVESEETGGLNVNTCAAGETGLFQFLPNNYHQGQVVQVTGERLVGTAAARREQVIDDPVLAVRLGCQELARHRDLYPEGERDPWWSTIGAYNVGKVERGEKWCEYTRKVERHYLDACERGFVPDGTGLYHSIADVWPECARVQLAYDTWAYCERYRPTD